MSEREFFSTLVQKRRLVFILCTFLLLSLTYIFQPLTKAVDTQGTPITQFDQSACRNFGVCATDLGIMCYAPESSSISQQRLAYVFGDTFTSRNPDGTMTENWRSPVVLYSSSPLDTSVPVFESAAGLSNSGLAPEIIPNSHRNGPEVTKIPTSCTTLPNGHILVSLMSVNNWDVTEQARWHTNYAELAVSQDGGHSFQLSGARWDNTADNFDPYQMQALETQDNWLYMASTPAGRQYGPIILQRVNWQDALNKEAYTCWDGTQWGSTCEPILWGNVGEVDMKRLNDGTVAITYLNSVTGDIVTRTAEHFLGPWSEEKTQISAATSQQLYAPSIDPRSSAENAYINVSQFNDSNYGISRYKITLK